MPPQKRFSKTSITPLKIWYSLLYQNSILDRLCEARHRQAMTVAFPLPSGETAIFQRLLIRLEKPPAGHAVTGQFIIAGSLSVRACHAERYPRGASCCQLNHKKINWDSIGIYLNLF